MKTTLFSIVFLFTSVNLVLAQQKESVPPRICQQVIWGNECIPIAIQKNSELYKEFNGFAKRVFYSLTNREEFYAPEFDYFMSLIDSSNWPTILKKDPRGKSEILKSYTGFRWISVWNKNIAYKVIFIPRDLNSNLPKEYIPESDFCIVLNQISFDVDKTKEINVREYAYRDNSKFNFAFIFDVLPDLDAEMKSSDPTNNGVKETAYKKSCSKFTNPVIGVHENGFPYFRAQYNAGSDKDAAIALVNTMTDQLNSGGNSACQFTLKEVSRENTIKAIKVSGSQCFAIPISLYFSLKKNGDFSGSYTIDIELNKSSDDYSDQWIQAGEQALSELKATCNTISPVKTSNSSYTAKHSFTLTGGYNLKWFIYTNDPAVIATMVAKSGKPGETKMGSPVAFKDIWCISGSTTLNSGSQLSETNSFEISLNSGKKDLRWALYMGQSESTEYLKYLEAEKERKLAEDRAEEQRKIKEASNREQRKLDEIAFIKKWQEFDQGGGWSLIDKKYRQELNDQGFQLITAMKSKFSQLKDNIIPFCEDASVKVIFITPREGLKMNVFGQKYLERLSPEKKEDLFVYSIIYDQYKEGSFSIFDGEYTSDENAMFFVAKKKPDHTVYNYDKEDSWKEIRTTINATMKNDGFTIIDQKYEEKAYSMKREFTLEKPTMLRWYVMIDNPSARLLVKTPKGMEYAPIKKDGEFYCSIGELPANAGSYSFHLLESGKACMVFGTRDSEDSNKPLITDQQMAHSTLVEMGYKILYEMTSYSGPHEPLISLTWHTGEIAWIAIIDEKCGPLDVNKRGGGPQGETTKKDGKITNFGRANVNGAELRMDAIATGCRTKTTFVIGGK